MSMVPACKRTTPETMIRQALHTVMEWSTFKICFTDKKCQAATRINVIRRLAANCRHICLEEEGQTTLAAYNQRKQQQQHPTRRLLNQPLMRYEKNGKTMFKTTIHNGSIHELETNASLISSESWNVSAIEPISTIPGTILQRRERQE